ncbi:MAG: L-threonylcarbamoyladenylate synthase [Janthinobacterium lividum]
MTERPRTTLRLPADPAGIATAADILRRGGLVGFPTETVYGLGADANSAEAVAGIYAAKGRPRFNPLIAHAADLAAAQGQGSFKPDALALARAFWPGPLTLVVSAAASCTVSDLARAGLDSVALRVPAHPLAQALIAAAGVPVAAPSANRSGRISPTTAAHVLADLDGRIDAVLDGGATRVGVESTIVSCLGEPTLLRPGGVTREAIEAVLGRVLLDPASDSPTIAPGMLRSHYAPRAAVRLDVAALRPGEAGLDFGGRFLGQGGLVFDLSPCCDLAEAAANLFTFLRRLDEALGAGGTIAVAPIPQGGLGEAIMDRLARAAAER